MKKIAKLSREEMTAVCLLRWENAGEDGEGKWLMVKRPEKGGSFSPF
jgi:hypothetical protein